MSSGLKGYNVHLDGVRVNDAPIPESGSWPLTGLDPATDYSGRITITAVDNAGNESAPISLADLEIAAATMNPSPDDPLPEETRAAIAALVEAKLKPATAVDGALIAVRTPIGSHDQAFGGDRTAGEPLTLVDKVRFGSCTKLYTNLLVLEQIDLGRLSFDDTLDQWVPGVANSDRITIRHLLMMQSGILDYLQQDAAVSQQYFLNPTQTVDPIRSILSYQPLYEPGESASYSNSNTVLLGKILEALDLEHGTGRDIRTIVLDFCSEYGLNETEWPTGNNMTPPYSRAFAPNLALPSIQAMLGPFAFLAGLFGVPTTAEIEWTAVSTTWAGAAGALAGTIGDLARFGELLRDAPMLSPELKQLQEEVFTTYSTYEPQNPWDGPGWLGFGLGVIQWGHWLGWIGNLGGYMSVCFYSVRDGSVIAVAMNYFGAPVVELFYEIAYLLDPESTLTPIATKVRPESIPPVAAVNRPGVYVAHDPGDEDGKTDVALKVPFYV